MRDQEVVDWLWQFGHFRNPAMANALNVEESNLPTLSLGDTVTKEAVRSIQLLDANFDVESILRYGKPYDPQGDVDGVTLAVMMKPRCGRSDYGRMVWAYDEKLQKFRHIKDDELSDATGSGSWPSPGCDPESPVKEWHSTRVNLNTSRTPSKVKGYLDEAIKHVERVGSEVGIRPRHILNGSLSNAEHDVRWENIPGSVIGYAYFPRRGTCNQTVVARLDTGFQPDMLLFACLMVHEYNGHSYSLEHARGGIMNPSILRIDPLTWIGDPSFATLKRYFGGEPLTPPGPGPGPGPTPAPIAPGNVSLEGLARVMIKFGTKWQPVGEFKLSGIENTLDPDEEIDL